MSLVNTATFSDFVANMKIVWLDAFEAVPRAAAQIYKTKSSKEKITDFSSLDMPRFAKKKDEGDDAQLAAPSQGYRKTMTKYRVQRSAAITWEMRTYDKYGHDGSHSRSRPTCGKPHGNRHDAPSYLLRSYLLR